MARPWLLAVVAGLALVEVAACNAISGVGDFTFGTGTSSSSSSGHTASSAGSGGGTGTGGTTSGGTAGGGGGTDGLVVDCFTTTCPAAPDAAACCYDNALVHPPEDGRCVVGPAQQDTCQGTDVDGGRETRIECQRPSDCAAGEVCCGQRVMVSPTQAYYQFVTCVASCPALDVILCDPATPDCPMVDGGSGQCAASTILPSGYFICK